MHSPNPPGSWPLARTKEHDDGKILNDDHVEIQISKDRYRATAPGIGFYKIMANPSHGTLSGKEPNLIYTPDLNYHGVDNFSFKASDGKVDSPAAIISISVASVNDSIESHDDDASIREDAPVITINVLESVRIDTSTSLLKYSIICYSSISYTQALISLERYITIDSKTSEIITDLTEALSNGVPHPTLIIVGSTQMEIDKAEAINQISRYGTVDTGTGKLVFTVPQIHEALTAGVPQSAFLNAGIPKEAVDSAALPQ